MTSLSRTILDLAVGESVHDIKRQIQRGDDFKVFDLREMRELLERSNGHRGAPRVMAALETYEETAVVTRSDLERRILDLVTAAGLPAPAMNYVVAGYELDAYWAEALFGVELDVFSTHGSRLSFEGDRERDDQLLLAGIETIRVTGPRLAREPAAVVDSVRRHLARRGSGALD